MMILERPMEDQHQEEAIIRQLMPGENAWSEEIGVLSEE